MSNQDDLLIELWELARRINCHGDVMDDGDSMLRRYKYFVEHSEDGANCQYAKKCKELFLKHDYEDVKKQFLRILELYRDIEGEKFDK